MSAAVNAGQNRRFKTGWIVLLLSAGLMTLNHFAGMFFYLGDPMLFMGFAAFNLYSLLVVAIPFARREKWAWYATWILPVVLTAVGFMAPELRVYYWGVAAAAILGLLLTVREFFAMDS